MKIVSQFISSCFEADSSQNSSFQDSGKLIFREIDDFFENLILSKINELLNFICTKSNFRATKSKILSKDAGWRMVPKIKIKFFQLMPGFWQLCTT